MIKDCHKGTGLPFNLATANVKILPALDTLAQLGTNSTDNAKNTSDGGGQTTTIESFKKRARAKFYSSNVCVKLASIEGSHLNKSYWNTYHCSSSLNQVGKKFTGQYCGNRWCTVCNRIRTAKLIKGYNRPLEELPEKYFVTLTIPNVTELDLKAAIDRMNDTFKTIQEFFKKRKQRNKQDWQIVGLRKIECTYNYFADTYHPHFHLVVSGKNAAEGIVQEWLKRSPGAVIAAQDIRPAWPGIEHELFKYFAKIITKVGKHNKTFVKPLDVIFRAMWGLRVFQPIGLKKDVTEEIEDIQVQEIEDVEHEEFAVWRWENNDWVNHDTGEALTGYTASQAMLDLIENIVLST